MQNQYDSVALRNAIAATKYSAELQAWKQVKSEFENLKSEAIKNWQSRKTEAVSQFELRKATYLPQYLSFSQELEEFWQRIKHRSPVEVCKLFTIVVHKIVTPRVFPREYVFEYEPENRILILDIRLPDFERVEIAKYVVLKKETKTKPVGIREKKQFSESAVCLYLLRVMHEIVINDIEDVVAALTINAWVEYIDKTTGQIRSVVVMSIFSDKQHLLEIDISRVDPVSCIEALGGRFAGLQHGYVPIAPIVRLRRDPRF